MNNQERINLLNKIREILANSEKGKFKNACSGVKGCRNQSVYKWEYVKEYLYFCNKCINLKRTELAI
tara:strand:+ start:506 stop:706 length:201 start_codon:yes stop_codon:yes gene_type:complete